MDDFSADAIVNRDEPIPVVNFERTVDLSEEEIDDATRPERKRDRLWRHAAGSMKENAAKIQGKSVEAGSRIQDRLLEKYVRPSSPLILPYL